MKKNNLYIRFFKRFFDFTLSLLLVVLLFPLLVVIALFVWIMMGSPVIFTQNRPGLNEKVFAMYKFRTMADKKDASGNLLSDKDRLTKFGSFLRSTSLDELPELFNILIGDMSFVGPRPLLVEYLPKYGDFERTRSKVRPGLTGLAQINGRNSIGWGDKFRFDVEYVNNITFIGDVKIIFRTVSRVLKRSNINFQDNQTIEQYFKEKENV